LFNIFNQAAIAKDEFNTVFFLKGVNRMSGGDLMIMIIIITIIIVIIIIVIIIIIIIIIMIINGRNEISNCQLY